VFLLSFLGAGVLVVGLLPDRVGRIATDLEKRPIRAALVGIFASLALLFAAVLFAITILGLPVTFLIVSVLGLAWLVGFVGICQAIGDRLPFLSKPHGRWVAFLVGALLVSLVGALPFIGGLLVFVASLVGVGAALGTRFGSPARG